MRISRDLTMVMASVLQVLPHYSFVRQQLGEGREGKGVGEDIFYL